MRIQTLRVTPLALPILIPEITRQMLDRRQRLPIRPSGRLIRAGTPRLHRVRRTGGSGLGARGRSSQIRAVGGSGHSEGGAAVLSCAGVGVEREVGSHRAGRRKSGAPG